MTTPPPQGEKKYTYAVKAYKNADFLNSGHARFIRVMCEYEVRGSVCRSVCVCMHVEGSGGSRSLKPRSIFSFNADRRM